MKYLFAILLLCSATFAEDKAKSPSLESKLAIREAQAQLAANEVSYWKAVTPIQAERAVIQQRLNVALQQAFREAGMDINKFDLDPSTLTFVAKPEPKPAPVINIPKREDVTPK